MPLAKDTGSFSSLANWFFTVPFIQPANPEACGLLARGEFCATGQVLQTDLEPYLVKWISQYLKRSAGISETGIILVLVSSPEAVAFRQRDSFSLVSKERPSKRPIYVPVGSPWSICQVRVTRKSSQSLTIGNLITHILFGNFILYEISYWVF